MRNLQVWRSTVGFHFLFLRWNFFNPYHSSSSHTIKQCWGLNGNPTEDFFQFSWLMRSCEKKRGKKDHVVLSCYYQTHNLKNKTFWLILNDCLPDNGTGCQLHIFNSSVKQPAWAPLLRKAEWSSSIYWYLLYITSIYSQLLDTTITEWSLSWMIWSSASKRTDKTKLWQECCGALSCQCLRRWKQPCTHLAWFVWNHDMKGALYGVFQFPFQRDKGSVSNLAISYQLWSWLHH